MTFAHLIQIGSDDNEMSNDEILNAPKVAVDLSSLTMMHPDQCEFFAANYDTFTFYYNENREDETLYAIHEPTPA